MLTYRTYQIDQLAEDQDNCEERYQRQSVNTVNNNSHRQRQKRTLFWQSFETRLWCLKKFFSRILIFNRVPHYYFLRQRIYLIRIRKIFGSTFLPPAEEQTDGTIQVCLSSNTTYIDPHSCCHLKNVRLDSCISTARHMRAGISLLQYDHAWISVQYSTWTTVVRTCSWDLVEMLWHTFVQSGLATRRIYHCDNEWCLKS